MARKKHSAEQIVAILRQIEVELANHKSIGQACKEAGINQQTYYRWRKEYGGLKLEQARRALCRNGRRASQPRCRRGLAASRRLTQ
jgi:transposase-like protein